MKIIIVTAYLITLTIATLAAGPPMIFSSDGKYLGNLSNNDMDQNSISNNIGRYGNDLMPNSIRNNVGRYGSDTSQFSPNNDMNIGRPYRSRSYDVDSGGDD
jgi:hypothetical protein